MRRKEPYDVALAGQPLSKEQGRICRKAADYRGARVEPQVIGTSDGWVRPAVVLDTNAVLDLYWFEEPALQALVAALEDGLLRWCATSAMRDELCHVMEEGALANKSWDTGTASVFARAARTRAAFDRQAHLLSPPSIVRAPRCSDPQDQMFIDLAVGTGAHWLFSRDKAVLKLSRKVLSLCGCKIVRPLDWTAVMQRERAAPGRPFI